jgi:hypothetical protein
MGKTQSKKLSGTAWHCELALTTTLLTTDLGTVCFAVLIKGK